MKKFLSLLLAGLLTGSVAACGTPASSEQATAATAAPASAETAGEPVELVVFAAASLTETLTEIAEDYKEVAPDVTLTFNFDSSGTLKTQIQEGAACAAPPVRSAAARFDINHWRHRLFSPGCDPRGHFGGSPAAGPRHCGGHSCRQHAHHPPGDAGAGCLGDPGQDADYQPARQPQGLSREHGRFPRPDAPCADAAARGCDGLRTLRLKRGNSPARRCLTGLFPLLDTPSTKFDAKSRTRRFSPRTHLPPNFPGGVCAGRHMSAGADDFLLFPVPDKACKSTF